MVGAGQTRFTLHTNVVARRCAALHTKIQEHMTQPESTTQTLFRFAHVLPSTFQTFLVWLYTSTIVQGPKCRPHDPEPEEEHGVESRDRLVRGLTGKAISTAKSDCADLDLVNLYQFATEHGIRELGNAVLTALAAQNERNKCTCTMLAVERAYATKAANPQLCGYLSEEAARRLTSGNVPKSVVHYPADYVQRILQKKFGTSGQDRAKMSTSEYGKRVCDYHFTTGCNRDCPFPMEPPSAPWMVWYVSLKRSPLAKVANLTTAVSCRGPALSSWGLTRLLSESMGSLSAITRLSSVVL